MEQAQVMVRLRQIDPTLRMSNIKDRIPPLRQNDVTRYVEATNSGAAGVIVSNVAEGLLLETTVSIPSARARRIRVDLLTGQSEG